jgi:menaquinone-dependent protoporphyrinogen oxidase
VTATRAREHRVLAGKLVKRQLGFGERAIVVALRVPEGDFRDWAEIKGWASQIAESLGSGEAN